MESIDDEEFSLENYLNKCRCCFRSLNDQEFKDITKDIESRFLELTQIYVKV